MIQACGLRDGRVFFVGRYVPRNQMAPVILWELRARIRGQEAPETSAAAHAYEDPTFDSGHLRVRRRETGGRRKGLESFPPISTLQIFRHR